MSVLRIHKKTTNFVILDKTCMQEKTISWSAKGLHSYLMGLPDNWQVRVSDLQTRATNGRDSVRAILSELERAGYLKKSAVRDTENGQFSGAEYFVLETPEPFVEPIEPETGFQAPVKIKGLEPAPGNPSPDNPASEKATLINNKIINNKLINKQTATKSAAKTQETNAAAVVFSEEKNQTDKAPALHLVPSVPGLKLTAEDVFITNALTENQQAIVNSSLRRLLGHDAYEIIPEVVHCLLSPKQFTACNQEFSHKLNAIRKVMLRGDWQTPADMIEPLMHKELISERSILEINLQSARAELLHFTRLSAAASPDVQKGFETVIASIHSKIQRFEQELQELTVARA